MSAAQGLSVIYGKALDERLTHENAVLQDCLAIAMRSLSASFVATPDTRQALRAIRQRLQTAGIEVQL